MTTFTHALKARVLDRDARIYQPLRAPADPLSPDAPAVAAMTDLRRSRIVTTTPETATANALALMIHAKVRLLLVIDREGLIVGLVSAEDLLGEKPLKIASAERVRHHAVQVAQVMTPTADIQPLDLADVARATVRDVALHLIDTHRQHALVIESTAGDGRLTACGIFSATQLGRQLGQRIVVEDGRAQNFSELRRLIA